MGNPASCSLKGRRWVERCRGWGRLHPARPPPRSSSRSRGRYVSDDRSDRDDRVLILVSAGAVGGTDVLAHDAGRAGPRRLGKAAEAPVGIWVAVAWARCWAMRRVALPHSGVPPPASRRSSDMSKGQVEELESSTVGVDVAARVLHPCDLTRTWVRRRSVTSNCVHPREIGLIKEGHVCAQQRDGTEGASSRRGSVWVGV